MTTQVYWSRDPCRSATIVGSAFETIGRRQDRDEHGEQEAAERLQHLAPAAGRGSSGRSGTLGGDGHSCCPSSCRRGRAQQYGCVDTTNYHAAEHGVPMVTSGVVSARWSPGGGRDGDEAGQRVAGGGARGGGRVGAARRLWRIDRRGRGAGRAAGRVARRRAVRRRSACAPAVLRHRHPGRPPARPRVPPPAGRCRPAAAGSAALAALFAAPAGAVPGHRNLWPAGTALAAPVTHAGGVVTVDLDRPGRRHRSGRPDPRRPAARLHRHRRARHGGPGAGARRRRSRSRACGRTGSTPPARSRGRTPSASGCWSGSTSRRRAPPCASPVRVAGEAAVFEATLHWEVRRDGAVVRSGARPRPRARGSPRTPSRSRCRRATTRSGSPRTTRRTAPAARS